MLAQYFEIHIELIQTQAEAFSEILLTTDGILSVSIEDAQAGYPEERSRFGEPGDEVTVYAWPHSLIKILVNDKIDPKDLINTTNQRFNNVYPPITDYQIHTITDQDWVSATQSQFPPISIGQRIWVVPSWHQAPEQVDAIILKLDPGQAFGTGSHPTTHLCLEWLEAHPPTNADVLDYGCGSGILAIAAHRLGAQQTTGVDIDPQAILTAQANALQNKTEVTLFLPHELPQKQFDIVIANILSNPLKLMAGMLSTRTKIGGSLILSGILARQAEEVILSYTPWIQLEVWRAKENWICLAGIKTFDHSI